MVPHDLHFMLSEQTVSDLKEHYKHVRLFLEMTLLQILRKQIVLVSLPDISQRVGHVKINGKKLLSFLFYLIFI